MPHTTHPFPHPQVSDSCPECGADHMDLQALTFDKVRARECECVRRRALGTCARSSAHTTAAHSQSNAHRPPPHTPPAHQIAPMSLGRINMQYRRVECTPPSSINVNLDINIGAGSWLRMMTGGAAGHGAIKSVRVKGPDGSWRSMTNTWGNAWELNPTPALPWSFEFTDETGEAVVANNVVSENGKVGTLPTGVQFQTGDGPKTQAAADVAVDAGKK